MNREYLLLTDKEIKAIPMPELHQVDLDDQGWNIKLSRVLCQAQITKCREQIRQQLIEEIEKIFYKRQIHNAGCAYNLDGQRSPICVLCTWELFKAEKLGGYNSREVNDELSKLD